MSYSIINCKHDNSFILLPLMICFWHAFNHLNHFSKKYNILFYPFKDLSKYKRQCVITNKRLSIIGLGLHGINMSRTRKTARKMTISSLVLNHEVAVIQAYKNNEVDPTHILILHIGEVFSRWAVTGGVEHEVTPI